MTNTSATGGYLAPSNPAYLDDQVLVTFFQNVVAGVSGMPGNTILQRWQPEPANMPAAGSDWAALGVTSIRADTFPAILHDPTGNNGAGQDKLYRNQEFAILTSFYGPHADGNANLLRDGLFVPQNREVMQLAGMGLIDVGDVVSAPSLEKMRWQYRCDMQFNVRRQTMRAYPVLTILAGLITLKNDVGIPDRVITITE